MKYSALNIGFSHGGPKSSPLIPTTELTCIRHNHPKPTSQTHNKILQSKVNPHFLKNPHKTRTHINCMFVCSLFSSNHNQKKHKQRNEFKHTTHTMVDLIDSATEQANDRAIIWKKNREKPTLVQRIKISNSCNENNREARIQTT